MKESALVKEQRKGKAFKAEKEIYRNGWVSVMRDN